MAKAKWKILFSFLLFRTFWKFSHCTCRMHTIHTKLHCQTIAISDVAIFNSFCVTYFFGSFFFIFGAWFFCHCDCDFVVIYRFRSVCLSWHSPSSSVVHSFWSILSNAHFSLSCLQLLRGRIFVISVWLIANENDFFSFGLRLLVSCTKRCELKTPSRWNAIAKLCLMDQTSARNGNRAVAHAHVILRTLCYVSVTVNNRGCRRRWFCTIKRHRTKRKRNICKENIVWHCDFEVGNENEREQPKATNK